MYVIDRETHIIDEWTDTEKHVTWAKNGTMGVWLYEGEVEEGYDGLLYEKGFAPEQPEDERIAQLTESMANTIQTYLDDFAKTRKYDGILSACSYATSKNAIFAAEGQYCVEARDDVWNAAYKIQDDVLAGSRPIPTEEELLAELPVLTWPTERPEGM